MKNNDNLQYETDLSIKTEVVIVRLTTDEKQTMMKEAQQLGISISAFLRLLLKNWTNGVNFSKKD